MPDRLLPTDTNVSRNRQTSERLTLSRTTRKPKLIFAVGLVVIALLVCASLGLCETDACARIAVALLKVAAVQNGTIDSLQNIVNRNTTTD